MPMWDWTPTTGTTETFSEVNEMMSTLPRMRGIICVLGETGCGKTTLCENMGFHGVFPGQKVRNSKIMLEELAKQEDMTAPEVTDDFVKMIVFESVMRAGGYQENIIIDGFPRSEDQIKFMYNLARFTGRYLVFLRIVLPTKIRIERLRSRGDVGDLLIAEGRLKTDDEHVANITGFIIKTMAQENVRYIILEEWPDE